MSWGRIANTILECGKRADIKAHYELDNSFKGLPYKERDVSQEDIENLKVHFYHAPPSPEELEMVFVVSDTQDTFSPTGVFALDSMDNLWLLSYANIPYLWLSQAERETLPGNSSFVPRRGLPRTPPTGNHDIRHVAPQCDHVRRNLNPNNRHMEAVREESAHDSC